MATIYTLDSPLSRFEEGLCLIQQRRDNRKPAKENLPQEINLNLSSVETPQPGPKKRKTKNPSVTKSKEREQFLHMIERMKQEFNIQ